MTNSHSPVKLIECPRDAMQGLHDFIPTQDKIRYINKLLEVGFDTIDFGSFVSPKAIPQMRDTAEVLDGLNLNSTTSLLAIIANLRGAEDACRFREIGYLGFPLSLSETFQERNTNKSIEEAFVSIGEIQNLCIRHKKKLVVYLSMGFGNPYGDPYDKAYIEQFVSRLDQLEIEIICPSDTIGVSEPSNITSLFSSLINKFPHIEFGAHLHSTPSMVQEKIEAAWNAGCRRFDGALKGFGGCPMAKDELTGNVATESLTHFFASKNIPLTLNSSKFKEALMMASSIFPPR
ncbi:MAG: hydroxymethylglutaryl-CoA lyase [Cytophagaceae bacterium]